MSSPRRNRGPAVRFARRACVALLAALALPAIAAPPVLAGLGDRTLRMGSNGRDVARLQQILTKLDRPTTADGAFGSGTERNVRRYERSRRWKANGVVGCGQAHAMSRATRGLRPGQAPFRYGDRTLRRGRRGDDVEALQKVLGLLGFPVSKTGQFGSQTKSAVERWEYSVHWRANGVADCRQLHRMRKQARVNADVPAGARDGRHIFPVRGPHDYGGAGSRFGAPRSGHTHMGQDVSAAEGTRLVAPWQGVISAKQYQSGGAGHYIVLAADDGLDYVFMHLQSAAPVDQGQRVATGQTIGAVGCTGSCSGAHLHFEAWTPHWYDGGSAFDPLPLLKQWDESS
jgi:murein DD-endopeptidase MepM/ murein hydrolase activator NlpD